MKLLQRSGGRLIFGLVPREKVLFERILSFYPLRPDAQPILSREGSDSMADAITLLHDAQREQRAELGQWISRRLTEGAALTPSGSTWKLTLEGADADKILQVLNELRVGAWNKLGCPDELHEAKLATTPGLASLYLIMTVAGQFQMVFVHALSGGAEPGPTADISTE